MGNSVVWNTQLKFIVQKLRLERLKMGNFGSCKSLHSGIYELKVDIGSGYRIYFNKIGLEVVLLLCAGNKKFQKKDIKNALEYYKDYKMRQKVGNYD